MHSLVQADGSRCNLATATRWSQPTAIPRRQLGATPLPATYRTTCRPSLIQSSSSSLVFTHNISGPITVARDNWQFHDAKKRMSLRVVKTRTACYPFAPASPHDFNRTCQTKEDRNPSKPIAFRLPVFFFNCCHRQHELSGHRPTPGRPPPRAHPDSPAMQRRTFESPMEWEYQGTGPVDATSPFSKLSRPSSQNS